jgi:biotin synthase
MTNIKLLRDNVIKGYNISREEALSLLHVSFDELLLESKHITEYFHSNKFDLCTIINGKSGKCSEDCKYCAQSIHYNCNIEEYPLLDINTIVDDAVRCYNKGINRYSIVTSGKRLSKSELSKLCTIYKKIGERCSIKLCASHGLLCYDDFVQLRDAGVTRYHNNLETSKRYFPQVCTSHTTQQKIETIKSAKKAGLEVCSGGIIGLGESNVDRIDLAIELRDLEISSIPLNLLNPIKNTPFENNKIIAEDEFYRICAIFRFINPKADIRLAGGRRLLSDKGKKVFAHCINGTISGELLTTSGNDTKDDIKMIKELGLEVNS